MFGLVLLSFCPSLLAGFLFGRRGVVVVALLEMASVWMALILSRAETGMEGLALLILEAVVLAENIVVYVLTGSTPPRAAAS